MHAIILYQKQKTLFKFIPLTVLKYLINYHYIKFATSLHI